MHSRIDQVLHETKGPSVLNLGCTGGLEEMDVAFQHPGWLHGRLASEFEDLWGLDISERKVTDMLNRGFKNLHVGDAQDFELFRQFDTIVAGELIEHLPCPGSFLAASRRHLRPGGRMVVTTPNASGLANVLYAWLKFPRTVANPEHTMWFCPATLTRLAGMSGFRVCHWSLTTDYTGDTTGLYGLFLRLHRTIGPLIPYRLRGNAIVMVMEPA